MKISTSVLSRSSTSVRRSPRAVANWWPPCRQCQVQGGVKDVFNYCWSHQWWMISINLSVQKIGWMTRDFFWQVSLFLKNAHCETLDWSSYYLDKNSISSQGNLLTENDEDDKNSIAYPVAPSLEKNYMVMIFIIVTYGRSSRWPWHQVNNSHGTMISNFSFLLWLLLLMLVFLSTSSYSASSHSSQS